MFCFAFITKCASVLFFFKKKMTIRVNKRVCTVKLLKMMIIAIIIIIIKDLGT
jgi:hypothetical protein